MLNLPICSPTLRLHTRGFHMLTANALSAPGPHSDPIDTLLVVEDEEVIRLLLTEYLQDCGYRVVQAGNVAEAKAVLVAGMTVDLVFTDVNMPGAEDGFVLEKWLRQHHPAIKVLVTSGGGQPVKKTGDLGEPMITKPYTYSSMLQRIQSLLRQPREERLRSQGWASSIPLLVGAA